MKLSLSNDVFSNHKIQFNFATIKRLGFTKIEFNMKSIKKEHGTDVCREQKAFSVSKLMVLTLHSIQTKVQDSK
jgi:hypothetical protein